MWPFEALTFVPIPPRDQSPISERTSHVLHPLHLDFCSKAESSHQVLQYFVGTATSQDGTP